LKLEKGSEILLLIESRILGNPALIRAGLNPALI
jgi:hypothetical protein